MNTASSITFDEDSVVVEADSVFIPADTTTSPDSVAYGGDSDELKSKIHYTARDSIRFDLLEEKTFLSGNATVDYEDLHLRAARITIDWNKKEIFAEGVMDSSGAPVGRPEFSEGSKQYRTTTVRYNFETKKGKLTYLITQEGEGFVHGEAVKKDKYNDFFIRNGQYTTCDLDTPHFSLAARKLKLVNTGKSTKIVTGPAFLTIEDVPTPLFIPFGFFPNSKSRTSGLIFPSFGESASRGFYFQHLGYYFGFNDYFNLALTTDLYTRGSYNLGASSVYAKRYKHRGLVNISYSKITLSEPELPDYEATTDFHITWNHLQDAKANPNASFSASVNAGTSDYYRNNLSSAPNFLNNTFQSTIGYNVLFPGKPINLGLSMNHYQNLSTHAVRIAFPDVSFGVSRITPFQRKITTGAPKWYEKIGASYTMRGTNFVETLDTLLFKEETLDQMQNGIQHVIPISTSFTLLKYFSVAPSFNYTEKWYLKTVRYAWDADSAKTDTLEVNKFQAAREWNVSVGTNTRIYGMYLFPKGPVAALRHVITPSIGFTYRPDFSSPRYGYYEDVQIDTTGRMRRYSIFEKTVYGGPSAGESGSIGFSLDNNLEMKVRTSSDTGDALKKVKILESLRISSSYNLAADSMRLAPFSFNGRTTLLDKLQLTFDGILNPYAYDTDGQYYDRYLASSTGQWLRLTQAGVGIDFALAGTTPPDAVRIPPDMLAYYTQYPDAYADFNVPYNLRVSYKYSVVRPPSQETRVSQTVNVSGDLNITPRWKLGFYSWYDFETHDFTNVSFNFYRDLHCWEMRLGWIPFGLQESYTFQINVKSSVLQDLKWVKKKDFYDN